jgi:signal transduction histidine kinase
MSSQSGAEIAYPIRNLPKSVYVGAAITSYGLMALGYQFTLAQATHLTTANVSAFTLLQIGYGSILWRLIRDNSPKQRNTLKIGLLTALAFACSLLGTTGLGLDSDLYMVTIAVYFISYSSRTAIMLALLLYLLLGINIALISNWNWSDALANWFNLLFNFAFVTIFLFVLRVFAVQKARAEKLLLQLEQSNAELEQAHQQLQRYADEVEEFAIVRERTRLARDIHDTLGHYLSLLHIQLGTMSKVYVQDPANLGAEIMDARQLVSQAIHEVRNAVAALRPTSITTLDLPDALVQLCHEFENNSAATQLTLDLKAQLPEISQDAQMAFYRTAQEALTNIRKHTHASKVLLCLRFENNLLELVILNNGSDMVNDREQISSGFGLAGLRERFDVLGGQVTYGPDELEGYRVTAQIYITPPSSATGSQEVHS